MLTFVLALTAHADPIALRAPARSGLSGEDLLLAPNPVKVTSFVYEEIAWDVACKGSEAQLRCEVRGGKGHVDSGGRNVLHLHLAGRAVDVTVESSPVTFDRVRDVGE